MKTIELDSAVITEVAVDRFGASTWEVAIRVRAFELTRVPPWTDLDLLEVHDSEEAAFVRFRELERLLEAQAEVSVRFESGARRLISVRVTQTG